MRTCKTWNNRPTKLNLQTTAHMQHSNTDPTHTNVSTSTSLIHSWCGLNPQLNVKRSGSSDWLKKQEVSTFQQQTTNEKHRLCQTEPIRIVVHDERSRDWIINNGGLKTAISTVLWHKQRPFCQGIGLYNKVKCCLFWCYVYYT